MTTRPPLSAVIITLNEEHNLPRCLASLAWCEECLVVDSGSVDRTRAVATAAGARVLENPWKGYGQQKNWALARAEHEWVLFVDADEEVSAELRMEIEGFLAKPGGARGADLPRKTWYLGRWIMHGGWYPNRLVRLVQRGHGGWTEPEVHESLIVQGPVHRLERDLLHYTFRNVGEQVQTNIRFARLGARAARARGERGSWWRLLAKPVGKFLETYFWKLGFLDGFPGFVISINAAHSIFMKYVELRLEENSSHR